SRSPKIFRVLKEAELHAQSDVPVLITGESGTGKELLAQAIHAASPRSKFPFTPVNMASLTVSLFEAEFFGHTKGAFSGAAQGRVGYLEYTHHGSLFLDEIGNLQIELQAKLMRALQNKKYMKLGTSLHQKADVRFIAATNQHLENLMARGRFRKDLYYRIRGGRLHLPPLRERKEDIPLLIDHFLKKDSNQPVNSRIAEESMRLLLQHDYPGNIRELKSIMQSAVNLSQGQVITIRSLPDYLRRRKPKSRTAKTQESEPFASLKQVEKAHILKVYDQMGKNKTRTAKMLGIGMNTLWRKLKVYEVD
ncbi:MAG: sigma 54-interacting transcriptional regulator, partial [Desulfobacterales bacterium]